jgi:hypothetical protein
MNGRMIAVTPSGRSSNAGALERARGVSICSCLRRCDGASLRSDR